MPREFVAFDKRTIVRVTAGIRIAEDPRAVTAANVVRTLDAELIQYWNDKRRGRDRDVEMRYQQACQRARSLSLSYVPAPQVAANLPVEDP